MARVFKACSRADPIGETMKALREKRGYTIRKTAKLSGVSHNALGRWENGQRQPKLTDVEKVLNALGAEIVIVKDDIN